jgi:beta-lactamase regulating signal transducer with metallopeptidase domain/uncharacterized protein involved in exopolysaccharide biosynthesis
MNILNEMIGSALVQRIGWVLLHSLWQGALIGAVFATSRFFLRRYSANARYAVACLLFSLLLAAPVITFLLKGPRPSPAFFPAPVPVVGRFSTAQIFTPGSTSASSLSALQFSVGVLSQMAPWLAMFWLAGTAYFIFRLARSWWWVGKLRTRDNEPLDTVWIEKLNALRERLGISRPVRLLKSALVEVPTVIGWLRPMILLPASSLTGLSPEQLEAVLAHELAHVRRLDYLVNAFQCVVETLMFYHPVVWWISHHVREERENCCDDLVVEVCGDRLNYARALTVLETIRVESPRLAFAATGGSLVNRIRRLLGTRADDRPASTRELSGLVLVVIGFLLIALGTCQHLMPDRYVAAVRIKVERDISAIEGMVEPNSSLRSYDPYFIQTEFEVIQSEVVLRPVIEELGLAKVWRDKYAGGKIFGTAEALETLKRRLELRPVRNTSLMEIRVFGDSPKEAAKIANQIVESYRQHRLQLSLDLMTAGIKALEERAADHGKKIKAAQEEVDLLRKELNILDSDPTSLSPRPVTDVELLRQIRTQWIYLEGIQNQQESQLTNLMKLTREQLREAVQVALDKPDATLVALLGELNSSEQKVRQLELAMTADHPDAVRARREVEDLNRKIDSHVDGILLGLQNRLDATKAQEEGISRRLAEATSRNSTDAEGSRRYYEAKKRLAELFGFRTQLNLKIASQLTELMLPRKAMVTIVDAAVPPSRPMAPNRTAATVLIALGILLDVIGIRWLRKG